MVITKTITLWKKPLGELINEKDIYALKIIEGVYGKCLRLYCKTWISSCECRALHPYILGGGEAHEYIPLASYCGWRVGTLLPIEVVNVKCCKKIIQVEIETEEEELEYEESGVYEHIFYRAEIDSKKHRQLLSRFYH